MILRRGLSAALITVLLAAQTHAQEPPAPATQPEPVPAPATQPATQPSFLDEPARWQRTAAWISVGVAAVFLTTAGVLATSAAAREEDLQRLIDFRNPITNLPETYAGSVSADYEDKVDEGKRFNGLAIVAFAGAGLATTAAIVFFVLDAKAAPRERPQARRYIVPIATPNAAGISAGWEF